MQTPVTADTHRGEEGHMDRVGPKRASPWNDFFENRQSLKDGRATACEAVSIVADI